MSGILILGDNSPVSQITIFEIDIIKYQIFATLMLQ